MLKRLDMRLRTHEGELGCAYLEFLDYPNDGTLPPIARTIDLHQLVDGFYGPRLALDLDKDGRPLGLEILYSCEETDGDPDDDEAAENEEERDS